MNKLDRIIELLENIEGLLQPKENCLSTVGSSEVVPCDDPALLFEQARKLFKGTKRGFKTEYENFRKKHDDWREVAPLLVPAVERQIIWRQRDERYWKNFQTWINQRCWEEESAEDEKPVACIGCDGIAKTWSSGKGLCENCKENWYKIRSVGWGVFTEYQIEDTVKKGAALRPRANTKDKEMVNADRQRELIEDIARDTFK